MRFLVVRGSRMGGTAELAEWSGLALREAGIEVDVKAAADTHTVRGYDAAIAGGAPTTSKPSRMRRPRWSRGARPASSQASWSAAVLQRSRT